MSIEGRVAIVTGASRGIGRAISEGLGGRGVGVALAARPSAELEAAAAAIVAAGGRAVAVATDVRRYSECESLVEQTIRELGRLDFVINNAGIGLHAPVVDTTPEAFSNVLATNLLGTFHVTRAALPSLLRQQSGTIVQIASLAGTRANPNLAAYSASKFAILGFTESLMLEVRHAGIKVAAICPGSVQTGFLERESEPWKLSPRDVLDAVVYLLESKPAALPSRIELRPLKPEK